MKDLKGLKTGFRYHPSFPWETIDPLISDWLSEDLGRGDITSDLLPLHGVHLRGIVKAKSDGVLAGMEGFLRILTKSEPDLVVENRFTDGSYYEIGDELVGFSGGAANLLHAERPALNLLNHLCGIAGLTREFVKRVEGTGARIVDTRKNIPGLRALQKYAVRCGGGLNHRADLGSSVMLKDNHLMIFGDEIENIISEIKNRIGHTVKIEVEIDHIEKLDRIIKTGIDIVMLDNMEPDEVAQAVKRYGDRVILEASGGITLENVRAYAETGVHYISVGALTHSARSADNSLQIIEFGIQN